MDLIAAAVLEERRQYNILEDIVRDGANENESSSCGDQDAE